MSASPGVLPPPPTRPSLEFVYTLCSPSPEEDPAQLSRALPPPVPLLGAAPMGAMGAPTTADERAEAGAVALPATATVWWAAMATTRGCRNTPPGKGEGMGWWPPPVAIAMAGVVDV